MYLAESSETRGGGRGRVVEVDVDVDVDAESRVGESWSDRYTGLLCVCVWKGGGASAASKQASSTRHAGQPPPQLRRWELGNPWVDRDRVCGMVEQARTREQTALGWLFWGRQVEGGRLGAGSREQGAWARAGLVHRRGGVVAGPGLELELDFGPVGTIPTMGRFRWSQRPPALYVCVCNWSQSRYRQRLPIPIATDSPWRLATLTMSRLRRQRQQQQRGDGEGGSFFFSFGRGLCGDECFPTSPRVWCDAHACWWQRSGRGEGGRERDKVGVEVDDGNEGGRKGSVRGRRGGIRTGSNKKCDGVHGVHISDQTGRGQDTATGQGRSMGQGSPLGRTRQAVSLRDPPEVPGTCGQAAGQVPPPGPPSGFHCASLSPKWQGMAVVDWTGLDQTKFSGQAGKQTSKVLS